MTNKDGISVEGVRALLEGTTPGPWQVDAVGVGSVGSVETVAGDSVAQTQPRQPLRAGKPDAERIANAAFIAEGPAIARAYLALSEERDGLALHLASARAGIESKTSLLAAATRERDALSERVGELADALRAVEEHFDGKARDKDWFETERIVRAAFSHKGMDHG